MTDFPPHHHAPTPLGDVRAAEHSDPAPAAGGEGPPELRRFVVQAAQLLEDRHCENIVIFDVRGVSQLTHYIVVASGTSDRQMKAVGEEVARRARENDLPRYGAQRDEGGTWIVLDFVEVMVHLFEPTTRAHYDLEMMWGDAPRVDWRR